MDYEPLGESDAAFAPIGSIPGGFPWDFHHISASPIWIDPGDCSRKPFLHVSIVKTSELPNKLSMSSMNHPGLSEKRLPHATLKFTGLFWLSPGNYHNGNCHNLRVYYISFWDTTLHCWGSRGWPMIWGSLERKWTKWSKWSKWRIDASGGSLKGISLMTSPTCIGFGGFKFKLQSLSRLWDMEPSDSFSEFRSWATNQWCLDWSPILPIYFGSRGLALVAL